MQQAPITKYRLFPRINLPDRTWPDQAIERAPVWCSVDLRDGNQALSIPMSVKEKLEMFQTLVRVGFKEIEVGFPSSSEIEYAFTRQLIEDDLIPDDVVIQVLVQCKENLILGTFEAIQGAKQAIVHLYNSTNPLQRRVTFGMSKAAIKGIAEDGTRMVKSLVSTVPHTRIRFEYSPESFSDTETDFALDVCEAVMDIWEPTPDDPIILNLPNTVEIASANVHADQIEWFCRHMKERNKAIISLHTHNDRGTGVAASELGLMAGADRVEGTLFGNGERTGNVDIIILALNMYAQGVDPGLDFSNLNFVRATYERCTRMAVDERHPYSGDLVFTAFSGSHQDAIKKGMDQIESTAGALWQVPYLPIDPQDIGRTYKAIIRINSQSGKGGVAYVLEREFGLEMPKKMQPEFGAVINRIADQTGNELSPAEILVAFKQEYLEIESPLCLKSYRINSAPDDHHRVTCEAEVTLIGKPRTLTGTGNGPIAAMVNALENSNLKDFRLLDFREHAITGGSSADAAAYIEIERLHDKHTFFGASIDPNIEMAGLKALISALNRSHREAAAKHSPALQTAG